MKLEELKAILKENVTDDDSDLESGRATCRRAVLQYMDENKYRLGYSVSMPAVVGLGMIYKAETGVKTEQYDLTPPATWTAEIAEYFGF
jgi:hypothetical protein